MLTMKHYNSHYPSVSSTCQDTVELFVPLGDAEDHNNQKHKTNKTYISIKFKVLKRLFTLFLQDSNYITLSKINKNF